MDPLTMGLIGGGVSLLGGLFQGIFNQNSANSQMAFQERMSDTSYQRGVADMKKAGINPMLAVMRGGASTPSGADAQIGNIGGAAVEGFSTSVNSAARMAQLTPEIDNTKADTALKSAQVGAAHAQTIAALASASLNSANAQTVNATRPYDVLSSAYKSDVAGYGTHGAKAAAATADTAYQYATSPIGRILQMIGFGGKDATSAFKMAGSVGEGGAAWATPY